LKRKELQDAVEEKAQQAAEFGAQAYSAAKAKIGPYVEQAGDKLSPYVEQAGDKIGPYVEQAGDKIGPYVDKVAPLAQDAVSKSAAATLQALETLQPHIEEALAKIAPAIEDARGKVTTDLMPKVADILHEVADRPLVKDAAQHLTEVAQSLPGVEVELVENKKGGATKKVLLVGGIAVGLAGVLALIKQLTSSRSGWQAHPASTYTPPTFSATQADADMTAEGAPPVDEPGDTSSSVTDDLAAADAEETADLEADLGVTPEGDVTSGAGEEDAAGDEESAAPQRAAEDDPAGEDKPFRS
jgi:hypothetical protein